MVTIAQRRTAAAAAIILLLTVLQYVLFTVSPDAASASHVIPVTLPGNPNCEAVPGTSEVLRLEDGDLANGTYSAAGGTITVSNLTQNAFDWSAAGIVISAVFVKAGNGGNLYNYLPAGETSDTNLVTPGKQAISHITFCVGGVTTTTTEGTTTTTEGTTTTTEATTTTTEATTTTTEATTTTTEATTTTTQATTTTTQATTTTLGTTTAVLSALGDYVWLDRNGDCTQNESEPALAGIQVDLFDDGVFVASTTTDASGGYLFEGLQPSSTYQVRFTLTDTSEVDYAFTEPCSEIIPDDVDSDAVAQLDSNVGLTGFIDLPAGVTDRTWDAGVVELEVRGIQIESTTTTIQPVTVGTLPFTGLETEDLVFVSLALLAAGALLGFAVRPRHDADSASASGWFNR